MYNRYLMVMYRSGGIFQAKLYYLITVIDVISIYILNIMVLIKDGFTKRKDSLKVIFSGVCIVGMKINSPECSLGLKDVPYLGYSIIWYGIKPDTNKVQIIIVMDRSTTTT